MDILFAAYTEIFVFAPKSTSAKRAVVTVLTLRFQFMRTHHQYKNRCHCVIFSSGQQQCVRYEQYRRKSKWRLGRDAHAPEAEAAAKSDVVHAGTDRVIRARCVQMLVMRAYLYP